ncbi:transposase (IS4-like) [Halorhabdus tiamatea SARL4B]|uniref:Transposase (IS4-like) n=1 Tax=Halorhabdus tiamatea SARL4B TaxID=1033806 RepID=S6D8N3_9EURY|nr:transposase (IS4-like) [Halorhabdus tiamatea SARL4B]
MLERNSEQVEILTADKGYDSAEFREYLRSQDVRPVIKHREFSSLDRAHNARLDDEIYGQRVVVESIFAAVKQRFGGTLRARTWFGQFRELVLKAAVFNLCSTLSH